MTSRAGASVTVKARAISTICRRAIERSPTMVAGVDAVAGEDRVELARDQRARRGAASRSRASAGCMMRRVLGHGQVRAERQLLEDAAHAGGVGGARPT